MTTASNNEISALEFWGEWTILPLPLLPVAPGLILSVIGEIDLFKNHLSSTEPRGKKSLRNYYTKNLNMHVQ